MGKGKFIFIPALILVAFFVAWSIKTGMVPTKAVINITETTQASSEPRESLPASPAVAYQTETGQAANAVFGGLTAESAGRDETSEGQGTELVAYKGPVRHIFFHPLILYPEKAFSGSSLSQGFNDWFVTVKEFRQILESIYENGYILVSMDSVCSIEEANGQTEVKKKELLLPKGKKPLVLSIDDMNYYDYMVQNGCASKLCFDQDGHTAVESKGKDGNIVTDDNDIVPIVDEFIRQHPDFSFNGAKGLIALTGYEGILGYRTNNSDSPSYEEEKTLARDVVNRLKEEGWSFACHGYGHLDAVKVSLQRFEKDCERWKEEVEPLVGKTPVYIYPYGSALKFADEKFKLLRENGFSIFCGVGPDGVIEYKGSFVYLDRKNVDGISIAGHSRSLKDLFDCDAVLDTARPEQYRTGKSN